MMIWLQRITFISFLMCLFFAIPGIAHAQLLMDLEADENLSNSQSINIQSLLVNDGTGPNLFRIYLQNNAEENINDLYFRIVVESDNIGRIAEVEQLNGQPFGLSPGQQVFATNNNLGNGLPGVEEAIQFKGDLTPAGEEFVNSMQGITTLPPDQYRITIEIYQGSVGGTLLVSKSAEIGVNLKEDDRGFYLLAPGDEVGSEAEISNRYPYFQWQGSTGVNYRLIVVEEKAGESPQSLMEGAESTPPIRSNGSSASGSLVGYEMLDVVVNQTGFQYPNSGVQSLEPTKKYYWRIISQLKSGGNIESRRSEIWSFSLLDSRASGNDQMSEETLEILRQLLGDRHQNITEEGYSFQSISNDEQVYQDGQALQKLMELSRMVEQGDISIIIEER